MFGSYRGLDTSKMVLGNTCILYCKHILSEEASRERYCYLEFRVEGLGV